MENKIMLANIFEVLKIEEEENDRLTNEIEEMKIAKQQADIRYLEDVKYVRLLQVENENLKGVLISEQRAYQMEHQRVLELEQQIEKIRTALGGA